MYYKIHGSGDHTLVLLHGAFAAIGSSFGSLLPELARPRQMIAFEYQGHGHTADIDRPMRIEQLAVLPGTSHTGMVDRAPCSCRWSSPSSTRR